MDVAVVGECPADPGAGQYGLDAQRTGLRPWIPMQVPPSNFNYNDVDGPGAT
jgi:hypothetical protein